MIIIGLFSSIGSAIGGIGSSIVGGIFNKNEAEKNRDWQEEMSNTSIQRRMADLREAGLNPLLATNSASAGASTPSGAQANIDTTGIHSGINNGFQLALQAKNIEAEVDKKRAETDATRDKMITEELNRQGMALDNLGKEKGLRTEELKQNYLSAQTDNERARILTEYARRNNIDQNTMNQIQQQLGMIFDLNVKKMNPALSREGLEDSHEADLYNNPTRAIAVTNKRAERAIKGKFKGDPVKDILKSMLPGNAQGVKVKTVRGGYRAR